MYRYRWNQARSFAPLIVVASLLSGPVSLAQTRTELSKPKVVTEISKSEVDERFETSMRAVIYGPDARGLVITQEQLLLEPTIQRAYELNAASRSFLSTEVFESVKALRNVSQASPSVSANSMIDIGEGGVALQTTSPLRCSMDLVNEAGRGWFRPIQPFSTSLTVLRGVGDAGVIGGYYVDPSTFIIQPLKVRVSTQGVVQEISEPVLAASGTTFQQAWILGVSQSGDKLVGSGCYAGTCACMTQDNPSFPQWQTPPSTNSCKMRATLWNSGGASAQLISRLGTTELPSPELAMQSEAVGVSDGGSFVAGSYRVPAGSFTDIRGFRWKLSGGLTEQLLPDTPGNLTEPYRCNLSEGLKGCDVRVAGMSSDGNCVAGTMWGREANYFGNGFRAFRYCYPTGPNSLVTVPRVPGAPVDPFILPRAHARGIASDGKAVVGSDINGHSRPSFPGFIIPQPPPGFLLLNGQHQLQEAFRWRPQGIGANGGQSAPYGDLIDPGSDNLRDSRFNSTSRGGCRSVGNSYGGGDPQVEGSERFRTAIVRPALSGGDTNLVELKSSLKLHRGIDVDTHNPFSANLGRKLRWQLIDATSISADGRYIVGTAVCEGLPPEDQNYYGFVVRLEDPGCVAP